ncbi:DUF4387 domain-containing protein [bacterium]|nr:DUF4387 domain-containing protein [bacterium]
MKTLPEIAQVIRSKNSSPFKLTLDIIFKDREVFEQVQAGNLINAQNVAAAYKIDPSAIEKILYFPPAKAIKIGMSRTKKSGSPGDTDVYGAQQHAPLLSIRLDL